MQVSARIYLIALNVKSKKKHTLYRCLLLLNLHSLLHGHSMYLYSCMLTDSRFHMMGRHTWCHSLVQSSQPYKLNL